MAPAYPDESFPKDEEAGQELKKPTLTNLHNARPQWPANAHAALDEAVRRRTVGERIGAPVC